MKWDMGAWLPRWRKSKGYPDAPRITPQEDLAISIIASGDWLLSLGDALVKQATCRKPSQKEIRRIASGLHAAGKLLDDAVTRYEIGSRGLKL